jgi:putative peptide zinc metalloprotease protein
MTVTAGLVPGQRPAPSPSPGDAPGPPRLAEGVELLGEYQGSGYTQPPSLVRRADGQVIQMSPLLYQVACRIDGTRDPAAIAGMVSADLGRSLTGDQVTYLITAKLHPPASPPRPGAPRRPRRRPARCSRCGRGARCCPPGP